VLEEFTTREQRSLVVFYVWTKGINANNIRKEMFPVPVYYYYITTEEKIG
jgi:hypothetical protein